MSAPSGEMVLSLGFRHEQRENEKQCLKSTYTVPYLYRDPVEYKA